MKKYSINKNKIEQWKADVQKSVLFYNDWFLKFAPSTYVNARQDSICEVNKAFQKTDCFINLTKEVLRENPEIITILRMATTPPLARDRLLGLTDVKASLLENMESGKLPQKMTKEELDDSFRRIIFIISNLLDRGVMPWLSTQRLPCKLDKLIATHVIGDRVCGSIADPIIRNAQEQRQLNSISDFLKKHSYNYVESKNITDFKAMKAGTFSCHLNVSVMLNETKEVNMPIDMVVMRKDAAKNSLPILIECKSAGDFTNTNKRRKEEATKIDQLKKTYGKNVEFILFLCGYFDSGYLGYEAAEGIDWVWEHRIDDLLKAGI